MSEKTIAEIAWEIYEQEGRSLHYRELTKLIRQHKRLAGKTPDQTVRLAIGTNENFERIAEGVYCPTEWEEYPRVRFGKDIAYDILNSRGASIDYHELGLAILEERKFKGNPTSISVNSTTNDNRFYNDHEK